jgi:hypothetical protein
MTAQEARKEEVMRMERIMELAGSLRIQPAELLRLAREAAEDASLLSVLHLDRPSADRLIHALEEVSYMRAVEELRRELAAV